MNCKTKKRPELKALGRLTATFELKALIIQKLENVESWQFIYVDVSIFVPLIRIRISCNKISFEYLLISTLTLPVRNMPMLIMLYNDLVLKLKYHCKNGFG